MPKISRFKKRLSDRSGFAYYELQMTYDEGSKIGADEFDTPPPSDQPLGGEGDSSLGDARSNYTSYDALPDQSYTVQYLSASNTINVGPVFDIAGEKFPCPIFYISGSMGNVTLSSNPQVNRGQDKDKVTLYCVGSSVTLSNGNGLSLYKLFQMDSGAILDLIYYGTDNLWHETSRSHVTKNYGQF